MLVGLLAPAFEELPALDRLAASIHSSPSGRIYSIHKYMLISFPLHIFTQLCICIYIYICSYMSMYVCMYVCMCVRTYVCVCMHVHIAMYTYIDIYICIHVCMCVYMCLYICIHICTHVYVCMYVCMSQWLFEGYGFEPCFLGARHLNVSKCWPCGRSGSKEEVCRIVLELPST